ncbi:MAG TPA: sigma-54 dependent transcriptional regulator [Pyrinomonadaceae bacterium]|nr:sigma-54 dependent transcriptional regulator [Pyrinomonadaceae bacterium]
MARSPNSQSQAIKILVVDDERGARMALEVPLRLSGYNVTAVADGREAIELGQRDQFDVVLTDVFMPGVGGLEVVREFHRFSPDTKIIAMTAQGSLEIALQAIDQGAFDFIAKPFDIEQVLLLVSRAVKHYQTAGPETDQHLSFSGIIGHSPLMVRTYKLTAYAARTDATVLIEGESGTGKELIARAIHNYSDRAARPFTAVNCGALTETLLESELFGYTKGSFTGATSDRAGLFESTEGGTLFLDELGATSPSFQASLLRVLQEKEVRPIGEREPRKVDVRIIGATNTDLEELASRGEFRSDLFYRLSVLVIRLPPLRERGREDLKLLARHFVKKYSDEGGTQVQITEEAIDLLNGYTWPGNVRELENTIAHAVAVCSDRLITASDLPERIVTRACARPTPKVSSPVSLIDDRPTLEELNRRYIQFILAEKGGNKSRAAATLGINRRTLYRYLDPPDDSSSVRELSKDDEPEDPENNSSL